MNEWSCRGMLKPVAWYTRGRWVWFAQKRLCEHFETQVAHPRTHLWLLIPSGVPCGTCCTAEAGAYAHWWHSSTCWQVSGKWVMTQRCTTCWLCHQAGWVIRLKCTLRASLLHLTIVALLLTMSCRLLLCRKALQQHRHIGSVSAEDSYHDQPQGHSVITSQACNNCTVVMCPTAQSWLANALFWDAQQGTCILSCRMRPSCWYTSAPGTAETEYKTFLPPSCLPDCKKGARQCWRDSDERLQIIERPQPCVTATKLTVCAAVMHVSCAFCSSTITGHAVMLT